MPAAEMYSAMGGCRLTENTLPECSVTLRCGEREAKLKARTPDMPLRKTVRFFSRRGLGNGKSEAEISSRENGFHLV